MSIEKRTCSVEGCEGDYVARGWCRMHYMRWKRRGTPEDPPPRMCSIEGCDRPHKSHGWCAAHYRRWHRHGDPFGAAHRPSPADRFWAKVDKGGPDECWPWTARLSIGGYGMFDGGYAHRFSYELHHGPIPDGLQIDHVKARGCTSRACVNPAHLEPVTCRENLLRGDTLTAANAAKTCCPQGHPYAGSNLLLAPDGGRRCRECANARKRRR